MNVLDGTVIGRSVQRHRHQEFIRFLNAVEREVLAGKTVHAVLDNYAAHKHPEVRKWLARHPRWTFHFTPTSASWLNAVEGFFAMLSKRRLKRGAPRGDRPDASARRVRSSRLARATRVSSERVSAMPGPASVAPSGKESQWWKAVSPDAPRQPGQRA
jgi:transposase